MARATAAEVDAEGAFPEDVIETMRGLGLLAPSSVGPDGPVDWWTLGELVEATRAISSECGSSGLIWAIHHVQMGTLLRHAGSEITEAVLASASGQPLVAAMTSEVGVDGDVGAGRAALVPDGDAMLLEKESPAASFVAQADVVLLTARRAGSRGDDQILAVCDRSDLELTQLGRWAGMGMRGTATDHVRVRGRMPTHQVMAEPYAAIASRTMTPYSNLLWSACWLGIAESAALVAQRHILQRPGRGTASEKTRDFGDVNRRLRSVRSMVADTARLMEISATRPRGRDSSLTNAAHALDLRLTAAELCTGAVMDCLALVGFSGYCDDGGPTSLSRQVRDVLSSLVMTSGARGRSAAGDFALALAARPSGGR